MSTLTMKILISGRVQGVGFRRYAQKNAQSLGIKGWARNLLDGRVEILAMTNEEALNTFLEILKKGPNFSLVREVVARTVEEIMPTPIDFRIHPDEEYESKKI